MVIRSFTAESVAAALKQVRSQLGGEAVVLKTKVVDDPRGGRVYEVTACLDGVPETDTTPTAVETVEAPASAPSNPRVNIADLTVDNGVPSTASDDRLSAIEARLDRLVSAERLSAYGIDTGLQVVADTIAALEASDLPATFIGEFAGRLVNDEDRSSLTAAKVRELLATRLEGLISDGLALEAGDRALVCGLAGAGKTSVIGRLAAELTLRDKKTVCLVTLDNRKVGAFEEIASYGDLLGIEQVLNPESDLGQPARDESGKVTLIDTPALSFEESRFEALQLKIAELRPTRRIFVVSALTRTADLVATAKKIAWLKPTDIVLTHSDLTTIVGGAVATSLAAGAPLSMMTASANGGTAPLSSETLAALILDREVNRE